MNIFHKITLKHLKENRTRTLVTIIGIILSAAMFTATTISVSSLRHCLIQSTVYDTGDWYGSVYGISQSSLEQIASDAEIEKAVSMELLGYSKLENCLNEDKPYLCIYGIGQDFTEMMPIHITEGRMPKNPQELLLPMHLKSNGGVQYALDTTLSLDLGMRKDKNGTILLNQTGYACMEEDGTGTDDGTRVPLEHLDPVTTKEYTVVGYYERPSFESYEAPGYTALTIGDGSGTLYDLYARTVSGPNTVSILNGIFSKLGDVPFDMNYDLLRIYGYSGESGYNQVLYGLALILTGIIMFGSISLIYNSFSISVSERTKQFGLLSSIGATKRQLVKSVIFEALFLSCIGIPLGILSGLLGIGITFYFVKDMIASVLGIRGAAGYGAAKLVSDLGPVQASEVSLKLHPSFGALAIAICISLLTILISAYIPARRAMKKSAIDAIRQADDIAIRPGKVKTSWLTQKLFGFEGMLATKNYKRSRRKYRATVISLFLSIVLFISTSSWCTYLTRSVSTVMTDSESWDILYHISSADLKQPVGDLCKELADTPGVTDAMYLTKLYMSASFDTSMFSTEYRNYQEKLAQQRNDPYQEYKATLVETSIVFLEDDAFLRYLKKENLPESVYYNQDSPVAVTIDKLKYYNETEGKFYAFHAFEKPAQIPATFYLTKEQEDYYLQDRYIDPSTQTPYCSFSHYDTSETIQMPVDEACEILPLTLGAPTPHAPDSFADTSEKIQLFYPYSFMDAVLPGLDPDIDYMELPGVPFAEYASNTLQFRCENYMETEAAMSKTLANKGLSITNLYNIAASAEGERAMMAVIHVFAFGFITLISLIAAANVFNTISTNLNLRKREFAMLKSIGMTPKGFARMMDFECLLYGFKGLLYGLPVSFVVTWQIYRTVSAGLQNSFYIPWYSIAIAVGSVFLVVFATMLYSMHKIQKENTIDALKNENL
ncbi:FtsX-like permease family protein [Lachnospiraceae bacterium 29-84]